MHTYDALPIYSVRTYTLEDDILDRGALELLDGVVLYCSACQSSTMVRQSATRSSGVVGVLDRPRSGTTRFGVEIIVEELSC